MKKKMIALMLIFAMLVSLSPAVAADENVSQPTIEEILNGYHEKAFAAHITEENGGASTYSRSAGSEKTLEEETVDELTAAGYEAYHVTGDNYEELEASLKTDFASMGLNPEGSYIVVISGEDNSENAPSSNARVVDPPHYDYGDEGVGHPTFSYTFDDKTYTMRYVTVTAAQNSNLGMTSGVELLDSESTGDMFDSLNLSITLLSSIGMLPYTGTIYSLFSAIIPDGPTPVSESLTFRGASNWTTTYIQIYNTSDQSWKLRGGSEYVVMQYFINHTYYDSSTNRYVQDNTSGSLATEYSMYYYDITTLKNMAVLACENNAIFIDKVEYVQYLLDGEPVITHSRWQEYLSYEPA